MSKPNGINVIDEQEPARVRIWILKIGRFYLEAATGGAL